MHDHIPAVIAIPLAVVLWLVWATPILAAKSRARRNNRKANQ